MSADGRLGTKLCLVCGRAFASPPSAKTVTCSPECSRARKSQPGRYRSHAWSDEAKARLAERGQTPNLALGTPAARLSPLAGPYITNQEAKSWEVVRLSTRERWEVVNLALWCREHADLFAPDDWRRACAGLRQVQRWLQGRARRTVTRWKDWSLARAGMPPDSRECRRNAGPGEP